MDKAQVIIVGAGPTGLMAANLLGQAGVATLVIEQHAGLSNEARAITIDDEGLRICQAAGLADAVCEQARLNVEAYYVSRKRLLAHVAPQHQPNGYPLISTFHQPDFEATLLQGLERFPHVKIHFGHAVEAIEQNEDGVTLTISTTEDTTQHIKCAYLLACDGGKSRLRQALKIALRSPRLYDLFYEPSTQSKQQVTGSRRKERATQRWLVIDYKEQGKQSAQIVFYCSPARPAVSVQAPQGRRRWEFMLKPGERDENLLDEEIITNMIRQAEKTRPEGLWSVGAERGNRPGEIERKVVYRFYASIATAFARGRIFLLGDAAHLMPPFGGQGMNSGLRDAYNLCWKLKLVLEEQAAQRLLASYQQERYTHVARMVVFSSLLGRLIMPTNPLLAWARDIFIRGIGGIPFIQKQLREMRVKPQPRYTQGFLLPAKRSKLVGRLLPQPHIVQNGVRILLDEALGDDFALLRLYERPDEAFADIGGEVWVQLHLRYVCVLPQWAGKNQSSTQYISPASQNFSVERPFTGHPSASAGEQPLISPQSSQRPLLTEMPLKSPSSTELENKKLETIEGNKYIGQEIVWDCDGTLTDFLGSRQDLLVLVRPDHYIMGVFHVEQVKDAARAMQDLLSKGF